MKSYDQNDEGVVVFMQIKWEKFHSCVIFFLVNSLLVSFFYTGLVLFWCMRNCDQWYSSWISSTAHLKQCTGEKEEEEEEQNSRNKCNIVKEMLRLDHATFFHINLWWFCEENVFKYLIQFDQNMPKVIISCL